MNSNPYVHENINNEGQFVECNWVNTTVQKMIHFHGIVLKMSIFDHNLGGCKVYFSSSVLLNDYPIWASKVMSLAQFKHIRAGCHPEVGSSKVRDKCHQLSCAIDVFDKISRLTFLPGPDVSYVAYHLDIRLIMCDSITMTSSSSYVLTSLY